ncbi:indolepyruvate ferredoxin oxidoreductase beta subunit [Rhodothalassium salexigens DSM 2132]|uniref:Indolepyruvate ferredoxin oxidoreductase beta subunit n=1 Tax=Rhodothalassium salexigens DSM 2132 TaxID=1188247 RepID=A0A4R2PUY9_RHOSA|nr:indolepyruvate oxidoreductase subunit beta family protein [Rhodothalassium salexigens]MBB4210468.1 indolepyruvate ferredoxin oxidoreductase beta subunit [Rhodothalassium salexigens DSM 2132]MBK1638208.1 hypothetical protein [Rhodothalassium salexigens DSM 2132]TCP37975.1 indolepyruvate ferredoxin oxidoreductase beta subunit [Rhodothalassium salexigens DSM 2132]
MTDRRTSTPTDAAATVAGDGDVPLRAFSIAIAALGGQGGGVLAGWIVETAEAAGYIAQATSVPGVAQRTGATIYCVEIFPQAAAERAGAEPVLSLMPVPGDVDVVLAAEWMEAGRAIARGFVTPDRTTLVASTHRDYAISEKSALADGIADADAVQRAAAVQARHLVAFDMQALAGAEGGVISAALFGALAGSGALAIPVAEFEETIRRGGRAVATNLAVFRAAHDRAVRGADPAAASLASPPPSPPGHRRPSVSAGLGRARTPKAQRLLDRVAESFPTATHATVVEGVKRAVDYQDPRYAHAYLDRLAPVLAAERAASTGARGGAGGDRTYPLTRTVARHLALWMTYEDTIRVADLKTRAARFERTAAEVQAGADDIVYVTEFMHPRVEELADTLPAPLGRWVWATPWVRGVLGRLVARGRHIHTAKLRGFLPLYALARLRWMRRWTLRYQRETAEIRAWLVAITQVAGNDTALAEEIARCQTLVRGYGDTHARGMARFATLMAAARQVQGRCDAATTLAALRQAALEDEAGQALDTALSAQGLATAEPRTPAAKPVKPAEAAE